MSNPYTPDSYGASAPQQDPAGLAQPTVPLSELPSQPTVPLAGMPTQPAAASEYAATPAYATQAQTAYPAAASNYSAAPVPQGTTLDKTNTFAFLSIIFAFLSPIAGIVFGHIGLSQIKRTGDSGRGIGLTGLILSYLAVLGWIMFIVLYISFLAVMFGSLSSMSNSFSDYTY